MKIATNRCGCPATTPVVVESVVERVWEPHEIKYIEICSCTVCGATWRMFSERWFWVTLWPGKDRVRAILPDSSPALEVEVE